MYSTDTVAKEIVDRTIDPFFTQIERGEVPDQPPRYTNTFRNRYNWSDIGIDGWTMRYRLRDTVTQDYGMWAIVDRQWTKQLTEWINGRSCLEIMAGAGWLSKALSEHGVNIKATDTKEMERDRKLKPVFDIEELHALEAIARYGRDYDILICSWPPYEDDTILAACRLWGNDKPIIYIGEYGGGCNAPDEFFEYFTEIDNHPAIDMHVWGGLHDSVMIGYWNPPNSPTPPAELSN